MSKIVIQELTLSLEQETLFRSFELLKKRAIPELKWKPDIKFYQKLKQYCKKKSLAIDEDYLYKVKWTAIYNRVCPCHPNHRKCPCKFILQEIAQWGHCVCGIIRNSY